MLAPVALSPGARRTGPSDRRWPGPGRSPGGPARSGRGRSAARRNPRSRSRRESNSVTCVALSAPAPAAGEHPPELGDREVGRHLLDFALDAGLRRVFDEHRRRGRRTSGCSSVLPGQSPPTALMCMPGSIMSAVRMVALRLVGGDGGDDVGAAHRLGTLVRADAASQPECRPGCARSLRGRGGIDVEEPHVRRCRAAP